MRARILSAPRLAGMMPVVLLFACGNPEGGRPGTSADSVAMPAGWSEAGSRTATADDIHIFDPYIGRFRTKPATTQTSGSGSHFEVEYAWFDAAHSIVKFTVTSVAEATNAPTILTEGFYGFDPFHDQLYTFAAFSWSATGFGSVGEFDRSTGHRVTWARSRNPDGTTTWVRDTFDVIDADSWRNVTSVRQSPQDEWNVVNDEVYVRID
jgi:hypothetical protein